jgi:endonuclease
MAAEPPNSEAAEEAQLQDSDASEIPFGLERDLQLALRSNIEQLEPGLRIADGGKEQVTDAGRIALTAEDQTGAKVVIELKAGVAAPAALTQLLGYMGVAPKPEGQPVRGILIVGDFHPRVVFAVRATTNVQLRRYRFRFTFESAE